jgi:hypothetical protein
MCEFVYSTTRNKIEEKRTERECRSGRVAEQEEQRKDAYVRIHL